VAQPPTTRRFRRTVTIALLQCDDKNNADRLVRQIQHQNGNASVRRPSWGLAVLIGLLSVGRVAYGDDATTLDGSLIDRVMHPDVHGQATYTEQETSNFKSPYSGANSLSPDKGQQTFDATLSLGFTLAPRLELWLAPELDQGFGLDNTLGLAGFPSGEAYKVGSHTPRLRSTRALLRFNSAGDGDDLNIEEGFTQIAQTVKSNRWILTIGKMSVVDVFDNAQYAHDPRNDFLNWSVIDTGSFDYAADAYGYSVGATLERVQGDVTGRVGFFDLSNVPNSEHLEPGFKEWEALLETEWRFDTSERPGRGFITVYANHGNMAKLTDLIDPASHTAVDPVGHRQFATRLGASINVEKTLSSSLNVFLKAGKADGRYEAYEFTEIDSTLAIGLQQNAPFANRHDDHMGLTLVRNAISAERIQYLAAGGLGILIGDGQLPHPGPECLAEWFYSYALSKSWWLTVDVQHIVNPAYNRDRGPVTVGALRLHGQF